MNLITLTNLFRPYRKIKIDTETIIEAAQKAANYALQIQLCNLQSTAEQYRSMRQSDCVDIKVLSKEMEYLVLQQKVVEHLKKEHDECKNCQE